MNTFRMVPVEENKNRNDGQGAETGLKNAKRWKRQILIQLTWELTLWLKNFFILETEVKEELIQLMSGKLQLKCVCLQRQTYSTIQAKGWKHSRKKLLPFQNSSGVIRTHHHPLSIKTELFDMSGSGEGKRRAARCQDETNSKVEP